MEGIRFGRYRLVHLLGRGGMGEVWRAYDTDTRRIVAIKLLPEALAADVVFAQRFEREAQAAASLNNPHIVPIHHFGAIDGRLYVDMRLIEGHDLHAVLTYTPLSPARAVHIVEQIASALDAAHRVGLVHRDVKPSNILVDDDAFAYLIDFGIARSADDPGLTNTGAAIGTHAYMAPERFRGAAVDPRSDVYALTCVLYECLTGARPYPGDTFEQVAVGHMFDPIPRPSMVRADLRAFDNVIAAGMAKNPDERLATAKQLASFARAALARPGANRTVSAVPHVTSDETHVAMPALGPPDFATQAVGVPSPTDQTMYRSAPPPAAAPRPPPAPSPPPSPPPVAAPPSKPRRSRAIIAIVAAAATLAIAGVVAVVLVNVDGKKAVTAQLNQGDCIADIPTDSLVGAVPTVDCGQPHGGEVYAVLTMPDGAYPGSDAVDEWQKKCPGELASFSAEANADPSVGVFVLYPTQGTWDQGDRAVTCIATLDPKRGGALRG